MGKHYTNYSGLSLKEIKNISKVYKFYDLFKITQTDIELAFSKSVSHLKDKITCYQFKQIISNLEKSAMLCEGTLESAMDLTNINRSNIISQIRSNIIYSSSLSDTDVSSDSKSFTVSESMSVL